MIPINPNLPSAGLNNSFPSQSDQPVPLSRITQTVTTSDAVAVQASPLHKACKEKNARALEQLLKAGLDTETQEQNLTPLMCAVLSSFDEGVLLLLKYGANPNSKDSGGNTPLHCLGTNQSNIFETLLMFGADPDLTNNEGKKFAGLGNEIQNILTRYREIKKLNPSEKIEKFLDCMERTYDPRTLMILLGTGLDPNTTIEGNTLYSSCTLLEVAILNNTAQRFGNFVGILLDRGARISHREKQSFWTPMHLAASLPVGSFEMVRLLCQRGADPRAIDVHGKTPAEITRSNYTKFYLDNQVRNLQELKIPLSRDFEIVLPSQHDKRVFGPNELIEVARACFNQNLNEQKKIQQIQNCDTPFTLNGRTRTFLGHAIERGDGGCVQLLLRAGANPNFKSTIPPLVHAIVKRNLPIVTCLIKAGANVDALYEHSPGVSQRPLHAAVKYSNIEIIKLLLLLVEEINDERVSVSLDAIVPSTPINHLINKHKVLRISEKNKAQDLLERGGGEILECRDKGAEIDYINPATKLTPLHHAVLRKDAIFVSVLLQYGANPTIMNGHGKTARELAENDPVIIDMLQKAESSWLRNPTPSRPEPSASGVDNKTDLIEKIKGLNEQQRFQVFIDCLESDSAIHLEVLLELKFDPNYVHSDENSVYWGQSALHIAIFHGRMHHIRLLIEKGAKVNADDRILGWTPLYYAASLPIGSLHFVRMLLNNGADPRLIDFLMRSPSQITKNKSVQTLLIQKGEELSQKRVPLTFVRGKTLHRDRRALSEAELDQLLSDCIKGNTQQAKKLIAIATNIDQPIFFNGERYPLLHIMCYMGKFDLVDFILSTTSGQNVNLAGGLSQVPPLWMAIVYKHPRIVSLLVKAGASLDGIYEFLNSERMRLWHIAARQQQTEVALFLLKAGAINSDEGTDNKSSDFVTPIARRVERFENEKMKQTKAYAQFLFNMEKLNVATVEDYLDCGVDVNYGQMTTGKTLLHIAAEKNQIEIVSLLLERGANPRLCDVSGKAARNLSVFRDVIVKLKLAEEAWGKQSPPIVPSTPVTPAVRPSKEEYLTAIRAVQQGDINVFKAYLEKYPRTGALEIAGDNSTLLHNAAYFGQKEIVDLLVAAGVNVNAVTKPSNETALFYAVRKKSLAVIDKLLINGIDVSIKNSSGRTAEVYAVGEHAKEIKRLFQIAAYGAPPQPQQPASSERAPESPPLPPRVTISSNGILHDGGGDLTLPADRMQRAHNQLQFLSEEQGVKIALKIGQYFNEQIQQQYNEQHCAAWIENFIHNKGFWFIDIDQNDVWKSPFTLVRESFKMDSERPISIALMNMWIYLLGFSHGNSFKHFHMFQVHQSKFPRPLSQEIAEDIAATALWLKMAELRLFLKFPHKYLESLLKVTERRLTNCYILTQDADQVVVYPLLVQTNAMGFVLSYSMDVDKKSLTHFTENFVPRERLLDLKENRLVVSYDDALKIKPSSDAIVLWRQDLMNYFNDSKEKEPRIRTESPASEGTTKQAKRPRKPSDRSAKETPVFTFNDLFPKKQGSDAKRGPRGDLRAPPSKRVQKGYREVELENHWTPASNEFESTLPARKRGRPRRQAEGTLPILAGLLTIEEPEINDEITPENFLSVIGSQALRNMRKTVGREASKRSVVAQSISPLQFPVQHHLANKTDGEPPFVWIRKLKPYQVKALQRIQGSRAVGLSELLCLDMGLGKTLTFTHNFLNNIVEEGTPGLHILTAPASLVYEHNRDVPEHLMEASIVAWQLSGRTATPETYKSYFEIFYQLISPERWATFLRIYPYFAHAMDQAGVWYAFFIEEAEQHQPKIVAAVKKHLDELTEFLKDTPALSDSVNSQLEFLTREYGYTLGQTTDHLIAQLSRPVLEEDFHKLCIFAGRILDFHPGKVPLPNELPVFSETVLKRVRALGYAPADKKMVVFTEIEDAVACKNPDKVVIITLERMFKDLRLKGKPSAEPSKLLTQPIKSLVIDEASLVHNGTTKTNERLSAAIEILGVRSDPSGKNNVLLVTGTILENNVLEPWTLFMLANGPDKFPIKTYDELNVLFLEAKKRLLSLKLNDLNEINEEAWSLVIRSFVHFVKFRTIVNSIVYRLKKTDPDVRAQWYGRIPERRDYTIHYPLSAAMQKKIDAILARERSFLTATRAISNLMVHPSLEGQRLEDQKASNYPFLDPLRNRTNATPEEKEAFVKASVQLQAILTNEIFMNAVRNGEQIVIVCDTIAQSKMFKKALKLMLSPGHPALKVFEFNGSKSPIERFEELRKFNKRAVGKLSVMNLMIKSGGYGVSTPRAKTVVILPTPWNPGQEDQAADRAIRANNAGICTILHLGILESNNLEAASIVTEHPAIVQRIKRNWESFFWGEANGHIELFTRWMAVLQSETLLDCLHLKRDVVGAYTENKYVQNALDDMRSKISNEYLEDVLNKAGALNAAIVAAPTTSTAMRPVGFENSNNNCWCNAMLQMVLTVPSLKRIYEEFAAHYTTQTHESALLAEQSHRASLQRALTAYQENAASGTPVDGTVSQNVRLALGHFFRNDLNAPSGSQEDASEALSLILGRVQGENHSIFTQVEYIYEGTRGTEPVSSRREQLVSTIILELQGKDQLNFAEIFRSYFDTTVTSEEYEGLTRVVSEVRERKRYAKAPEEFLLTVQRFTNYGMFTLKSNRELDVPFRLALPEGAVEGNTAPLEYELDAFVVHKGFAPTAGHYYTVKKENGGWWKCDDASIEPLLEDEVRALLVNDGAQGITSYMHHYRKV